MALLKILSISFWKVGRLRLSRSDTMLADVTAFCVKWVHCNRVCLAPLPNFPMYIHPLSYALSLCTHGPFFNVCWMYLHLLILFSLVNLVVGSTLSNVCMCMWQHIYLCWYMHICICPSVNFCLFEIECMCVVCNGDIVCRY